MGFLNSSKINNTELLKLGLVLCAMSDSATNFYTDTFSATYKTTDIVLTNTENKVFGKDKGYITFWGGELKLDNYTPIAFGQGNAYPYSAPYLKNLDKNETSIPIDNNVFMNGVNLTLNLPDGITANCKSGDKVPTNFKILFKGNMKEGDTVSITRDGKEAIAPIPNDCNFSVLNYNLNGFNDIKIKYTSKTTTSPVVTSPVEKKVNIYYTLTNCTSNITDTDLAPKTYSFTITPKPGYMFSGVQSYSYDNENNGSNDSVKVDITDPKKPYTFNLEVAEYMTNLNMRFSCIQIPPDTDNTPTEFTHVYNPSDNDLKKLTTDIITFFGNGTMNVLDIGAYITGLYQVPYEIPTNLIGDSDAIILANKKSKVSSPTVLGNNFTVDLGTISVTEKYNSNFDYSNTQCFLVCPYMDRIGLQIDDVIEHTLKLKFLINIYSGDCTLLVTSDNKLIYKSTFKIANKIPYIQNYVDNSNKNNTDNILFNDVTTAYVEIIRPKPLNNTIVSTEEVGKVKEYRGFVAIDDVTLNTKASYQEQQEIEIKLQAGVYINE